MKIVQFLETILNITILQKLDEIFFSFLAKLFQEAPFLIIILTLLGLGLIKINTVLANFNGS